MAKKIIAGNWKMNPATAREAEKIFSGIKKIKINNKVETVVCPPAIYLPLLKKITTGIKINLGVQDCSVAEGGAYTGQISASMIKSLGAKDVIIGHSERRALGESDEVLNQKVKIALKNGLRVIFCVGEQTRDERGDYLSAIKQQLETGLDKIGKNLSGKLVIAYEPVWAIGANATGVDSPDSFLQSSLFIKKVMSGLIGAKEAKALPILYGGSANAKNAEGFLTVGQADGLLVGRASLDPKQFGEIINIAGNVKEE